MLLECQFKCIKYNKPTVYKFGKCRISGPLHGHVTGHMRLTFRVHGQDNVDSKALPRVDLGHDFEGNLKGDEVAAGRGSVGRPRVRAAQEILVLDVDEPLRAPDRCHIRRVDAGVDHLACSGIQRKFFSIELCVMLCSP